MRTFNRFLGVAACFCALLALLSGQALASGSGGSGGGSGGGGGGGGSVNTAPPLIFDFTASVGGSTPGWSGDYTVTNSIPGYYSYAVLSINLKAKPLNLPDNTALTVTAYTSNQVTGQPLPPVSVTGLAVLNSVGQLKSKTTIYNVTFDTIVRHLDSVVIATPDGTVIASCHP